MNIGRRARGVNILLASGTPSVLPARDAAGQIPVVLPQLGAPPGFRTIQVYLSLSETYALKYW
jgi:hypothetical protein